MEGYELFVVMHVGRFFFPQSELEKIDDKATPRGTFWAEVYCVTTRENTWLVYYGEHVLGYSYVRFVHSTDEAQALVKKWLLRHEW